MYARDTGARRVRGRRWRPSAPEVTRGNEWCAPWWDAVVHEWLRIEAGVNYGRGVSRECLSPGCWFHLALQALMKKKTARNWWHRYCVLAAFTIELMFKCLICIEQGGSPRGHDLLELFDKLSAPTRERLE